MTRATVAVIAIGLLATGCLGSHKTIVINHPGKVITHTPKPQPTQTIHKGYVTYQAGATAGIGSVSSAAMMITAGVPSKSKNRLSPSYGYPPEHGYYVTFPLTIKNTGHASLLIERLDFYVKTPGLGKITTNDGAAPYSGAPQQLDTTLLAPGKTLKNKLLTFDVSHPTGTFYYAPGGKPSVAWTFSL